MRQHLGNGRWFETDSAKVFEEDRWFDGSNHISKATGSQWSHEELYRTRKGLWVLHSWSQWQGSQDSWEILEPTEAYRWLIAQGHGDEVPADVLGESEV